MERVAEGEAASVITALRRDNAWPGDFAEAVMKITHHFTSPTSFDAALQELVDFQQQPNENVGNYMVRARRHVQTVKMLYWQAVTQARDKGRKLPDLVECVAITLPERGLAGFFKQQYRLSNVPRFDLEEMRTVLESVERTAELRERENRAAAAAVIPTRFSNGAGRHSNRGSSGPDTGGGGGSRACRARSLAPPLRGGPGMVPSRARRSRR
eukprot:TRINITY_DN1505_c0_g1_i12.p1 TRINITY_DN1505_c0_g1~~TRINITY_DN1505_c0_g1_i12.p1  ORF type:complete len:212 (+),score=55.95 TRINITY_DN1505_c0_g1_i12:403-1038(+)